MGISVTVCTTVLDAWVTNAQENSVRETPATVVMPEVRTVLQTAELGRDEDGVNVAFFVEASYVTVPLMSPVFWQASFMVLVVIVLGFMSSSKVTSTGVLTGMSSPPQMGLIEFT